MSHARIGILVVAYNAASTLGEVLDRIPESLRDSIEVVLVSDDHSTDRTYEAALEYQRTHDALPIAVVRQPRNLGYGGNQKFGYRWLAERGCDIAVLLHGDGQYAPEVLPEIVAPLLEGRADVVLGSRMLAPGGALGGGMPLYKYVGNKVLTRFQNRVSGLALSEWHSGYRAFSLGTLARIPFEENSNGFDFDTEVLLQLLDSGARIVEVPIPTYYGDEICRVNGLAYARDVCLDVVRYRLARLGFGASHLARWSSAYEWKDAPDASHRVVLSAADELRLPPGRVLDLGCAGGLLGAELRARGHLVVGVDGDPPPGTEDNVDRLVVADLDAGLPADAVEEGPYDVILAVDVLEHLRDLRVSSASSTSGSAPGARAHLERAEHRSLVPAAAHRLRSVRLRPARHPRRDASALLHVAQLRRDGRSRRLAGGAAPPHGPSARGARLRRRTPPASEGYAGRSRASTVPDERCGRRSSRTSTSPCCAATRRSLSLPASNPPPGDPWGKPESRRSPWTRADVIVSIRAAGSLRRNRRPGVRRPIPRIEGVPHPSNEGFRCAGAQFPRTRGLRCTPGSVAWRRLLRLCPRGSQDNHKKEHDDAATSRTLVGNQIECPLGRGGGGRHERGIGKRGRLGGAGVLAALVLLVLPFVSAGAPAATAGDPHTAFMTATLADAISEKPSAEYDVIVTGRKGRTPGSMAAAVSAAADQHAGGGSALGTT